MMPRRDIDDALSKLPTDCKQLITSMLVENTCWFTAVNGRHVHVEGSDILWNFDDVFFEVDALMQMFPEARLIVHVTIAERAETHDGMAFFESRLDDDVLDEWLEGIPVNHVMYTH